MVCTWTYVYEGPETNGSQFFILYKSAPHLDGKHTVFGKLVGGLENLKKMANVEVDVNDKPIVSHSFLLFPPSRFLGPHHDQTHDCLRKPFQCRGDEEG